MPDGAPKVLDVQHLNTVFRTRSGEIHAVNDVSFDLEEGELLGVVGESGSGKSVTMMSLIRLIPSPPADIRAGKVLFGGVDLLKIDDDALRDIRGARIGFIFQDPMTSLNPVFTVGFQLREPLMRHMGLNKKQANQRAVELLEMVGIPAAAARLKDYPHQFSGGMRQRVMIAIALACDPEVLIADEPTTALDVTIQAQVIDLMKDLVAEFHMGIIFITHDLGVIAQTADKVAVMYLGRLVEQGPVRDVIRNPAHPYTRGLINALPDLEDLDKPLEPIPGDIPSPLERPPGCVFNTRCAAKIGEICEHKVPQFTSVSKGHLAACHLYDQKGEGK